MKKIQSLITLSAVLFLVSCTKPEDEAAGGTTSGTIAQEIILPKVFILQPGQLLSSGCTISRQLKGKQAITITMLPASTK